MKRLTKRRGGKFSGVCLGIADYLEIDVTVIRLIWIVGTVCTAGFGILAYLAAAFIMPYDN
jgi:phage shock protein PspC (stress-responsive transcriptional regulator)